MTQFISTSLHYLIIIKVGSSSKLYHHQSWIIIITTPTVSSKWCYLSILLVIGSSIEPALFHARCRSQHLYPTMGGPSCHHVGKAHFLHMTMEGPSCHHVRKVQHLHMTMGGTTCHHVKKAQHLHPLAW